MKKYLLLIAVLLVLCPMGVYGDSFPNLTGTWLVTNGTAVQFTGEITDLVFQGDTFNITQQDHLISGVNSFHIGDERIEISIAGFIDGVGKSIHIVDTDGGLYDVSIDSDDQMTVAYLNAGEIRNKPGYALALTMTLEREI